MNDRNLVMSYHRMRRWVGYLGISLPFTLFFGNKLFDFLKIYQRTTLMQMCDLCFQSSGTLKGSISEYYYSPMGELFVGTLCAVAFFLFSYKGYPLKEGEAKFTSDSLITNLAGLCALMVAIFPMDFDSCFNNNFRSFISHPFVGKIHYISAVLFFSLLAVMCLLNFRRTDTVSNFGKMPSHNFYKWCGRGIIVSLVLAGLFKVITPLNEFAKEHDFHYLFWFETTSLLFFGASWLKKGQVSSN